MHHRTANERLVALELDGCIIRPAAVSRERQLRLQPQRAPLPGSEQEHIVTDRVWLITGASRGIGAEIAKAVLDVGDTVVATARSLAGLAHLGTTDNLLCVPLDVTQEADAAAATEAALARFGRIDILVNNAGICLVGAVEETSAAQVEDLYRTNVFGLLNVTRAVLPSMRKRRAGHVINISSVAGYSGYAGFGVYSSTKFAVEGLSEALHAELAPLGIRVTVVEPGFFRSDILDSDKSLMHAAVRFADYEATSGAVRAFIPGFSHHQPGDPAKLARALVELANCPDPPLRLPLGPDTLQRMADKNAVVERETAAWRVLAASTDV
jgi:NAD(P)-dependent dehydrogenase (short-subunit alcohol dehydrogenase family)